MLLRERIGDRAGRDETKVHEHLAERRPGPILLREGSLKLLRGQEAFLDHDLAELPAGVGRRIHWLLIGRKPCPL